LDHIQRFREMSLRQIAALACVGTVAMLMVPFGLAVWLFAGDLVAGGRGLPLGVAGTAGAVAVGGTGLIWWWADRLFVARLFDHRSLPARPEFFDFQDLNQPMHWEEMGGKALMDLRYVVFDCETTGLAPSKGDEIISIAAVRVENGVVDETDAFSRLVNPGMPIPKESIKYHGITDDMVADEPTIDAVLPDFKAYAGDAILVAHNAAFDMKFLQLKEEQTGVAFPNLVVDTMLLSVFLEHESENHSLDGITQRMGITIEGRHTALGDSLATAAILVRMLKRLEARGITSLRQVIEATAKIEHVRKLRERF
jgi:DNA polymerase-3 subunit epsilon